MKPHIKNFMKYYNLGEQDYWHCEACGKVRPINNGLQIHHIIFRSHGGSNEVDNCICLCVDCHNKAHSDELSKEYLTEKHNKNLNHGETT